MSTPAIKPGAVYTFDGTYAQPIKDAWAVLQSHMTPERIAYLLKECPIAERYLSPTAILIPAPTQAEEYNLLTTLDELLEELTPQGYYYGSYYSPEQEAVWGFWSIEDRDAFEESEARASAEYNEPDYDDDWDSVYYEGYGEPSDYDAEYDYDNGGYYDN